MSAYRWYSPVEKFFGVIPLALPSTREDLWTANANNWGARVTSPLGDAVTDVLLDRYDEVAPSNTH